MFPKFQDVTRIPKCYPTSRVLKKMSVVCKDFGVSEKISVSRTLECFQAFWMLQKFVDVTNVLELYQNSQMLLRFRNVTEV